MRKKWSKYEIDVLKKYYPIKGGGYVSKILDRTYWSVNAKASKLKIKSNYKIKFAEKKDIIDAINNSSSIADALRFLNKIRNGMNYNLFKKYCNIYNINIKFKKKPVKKMRKRSVYEWLVYGSMISSGKLKEKLYKEGLKERKCELCGQDENWNGKKMSLILDHINGDHSDNRLENLRIVCPNCNATLSTHGGKNIKLKKNKKNKYKTEEELKDINKIKSIKQRKVERPPYGVLIKEIEENGYSATGRKYGVSDNAIRKWIKIYKKYNI